MRLGIGIAIFGLIILWLVMACIACRPEAAAHGSHGGGVCISDQPRPCR